MNTTQFEKLSSNVLHLNWKNSMLCLKNSGIIKKNSFIISLFPLATLLIVSTILLFNSGVALSQSYPNKPVRIMIPFGIGGSQDAAARAFNADLGAALGQPVIIDNRPGAGGVIGTVAVATSVPDGYTLLLAGVSHQINRLLTTKPAYNPLQDFAPISFVGTTDYVLVVPSTLSVNSVAELVRYAKAKPGNVNFASAGVGSAIHLSMAYFASLAGIDMLHVPLKGGGDALIEIMAARSQATNIPVNVALPHVHEKRLRLIAVTGSKRSKFIPHLPTVSDSGIPGYEFTSWLGLLGPAALPHAVIDRIELEMRKLLLSSTIVERLDRQGVDTEILNINQFGDRLRKEQLHWAEIIKRSGAMLD